MVLKDAADQTVWPLDVDGGSDAGQAIPTLITGQFLINDGSNLAWAPIAEMPASTGAEGYQLEVVRGIPAWAPKPLPFAESSILRKARSRVNFFTHALLIGFRRLLADEKIFLALPMTADINE